MKRTVLLAAFAFVALTVPAYAEMGGKKHGDGMTMEQKKEKITANIDKRISLLQELKSCISAAKEQPDMKKCHEKHEDAMDAMKEEMKKERRGKE